jgi:hypothetical protein
MGKLDQEKEQEFIEKMASKSDEEILDIIKVRHDYQPEASEAVKKIALERGIVDSEMNEIQKELNNIDEWHYELNGKKYEAVSYTEISGLIKNETLSKESLVWKKGFDDWKQIIDTELNDLFSNNEPPPLTGNKISNVFIWLLAFAPIIGFFLESIFAYSVNENEFVAEQKIANSAYWFITLGLNILLAVFDDVKLKNAGHKTNNLGWAIFLIPVYLWKRSNLTKQSKSYFWVWIVSFIVLLMLTFSSTGDISGFDTFGENTEITMVKTGYLTSCPNISIEEAVNGFFGNPSWEAIIAEDGNKYVNVTGDMTYMKKEVVGSLQFRIYEENNTFEINAFEINDLPQNKLMLAGLLADMFGGGFENQLNTDNNINSDLELIDYKIIKGEWGNKTISGTVKNKSSNEYGYAQIEFNLYDKDGNQIGSSMDNINNLEPNGSWKFNAIIMEDGVKDIKFKGITGY